MQYEFIQNTKGHKVGDIIESKPYYNLTVQRLQRGIIKPVAPKRETKVIEQPEVMKDDGTND
jgi:hypothetical protein